MVNVGDIAGIIEQVLPLTLSENWDNSGLLIGRPADPVRSVLVTVDVTGAVIREAVERGAALIVSHHPVIFRPLRSVRADYPDGSLIHDLLCAGLSVYCSHTPADNAPDGIGNRLARALDIRVTGRYDGAMSMRCGSLETPMEAECFLQYLESRLGTDSLYRIGEHYPPLVRTVTLAAGAFDAEWIPGLTARRSDLLIAGEVKYHDALALAAAGIPAVVAGHYATERFFCPLMTEVLTDGFRSSKGNVRNTAAPVVYSSLVRTDPFRR